MDTTAPNPGQSGSGMEMRRKGSLGAAAQADRSAHGWSRCVKAALLWSMVAGMSAPARPPASSGPSGTSTGSSSSSASPRPQSRAGKVSAIFGKAKPDGLRELVTDLKAYDRLLNRKLPTDPGELTHVAATEIGPTIDRALAHCQRIIHGLPDGVDLRLARITELQDSLMVERVIVNIRGVQLASLLAREPSITGMTWRGFATTDLNIRSPVMVHERELDREGEMNGGTNRVRRITSRNAFLRTNRDEDDRVALRDYSVAVASYLVDVLLGGGIIAKTAPARCADQHGHVIPATVMAAAPGRGFVDILEGDKNGRSVYSDPLLIRLMSALAMEDALCGQEDRSPYNLFVTQAPDGRVTGITGIDSDHAFFLDHEFRDPPEPFPVDGKSDQIIGCYNGLPTELDGFVAEGILALSPSDYKKVLGLVLTDLQIEAALARLETVKAALRSGRHILLGSGQWRPETLNLEDGGYLAGFRNWLKVGGEPGPLTGAPPVSGAGGADARETLDPAAVKP